VSRSFYRRREAEAERRHYVIDPSNAMTGRRGSRLLIGGIMIVWVCGSITFAYWLGAPYLRQHRNDIDPVEARLMADALERAAPRSDDAPRHVADTARLHALESRVAEAVSRIDEIRDQGDATELNEKLQRELTGLREQIAASQREIGSLRGELSRLSQSADRTKDNRLAMADASGAPHVSTDESPAIAIGSMRLPSRYVALGAVALTLLGNVVSLWLIFSRRRSPLKLSPADEQFLAAVLPRSTQVAADGADTDTSLASDNSVAKSAECGTDTSDADAMIEEMRKASVAGMEPSASEEDEPPALLIVVDEDVDYLTARAGKIEVMAENRLGLDFAVRITDRERAGLAGRRVTDSDQRSVA